MQTVKAKKQLGQHFLQSTKAINKIVGCLDMKKTNILIEIGPGTGVLTRALLDKGFTVLALEIDRESIQYLHENFTEFIENKKLFVIEKDCLEVDFGSLYAQTIYNLEQAADAALTPPQTESVFIKRKEEKINSKYYLIGNIPYYITGLIFRNTFASVNLPEKVVYLVQKEVADRVVAKNKKESIMSIAIKVFGEPKLVDIVKAGSFNPPPKVDSAILEISNIKNIFENKEREDLFFKIVKAAFLHKRKYALANIKKYLGLEIYNKAKEILNEKDRAEDVILEKWIEIIK